MPTVKKEKKYLSTFPSLLIDSIDNQILASLNCMDELCRLRNNNFQSSLDKFKVELISLLKNNEMDFIFVLDVKKTGFLINIYFGIKDNKLYGITSTKGFELVIYNTEELIKDHWDEFFRL